MATGEEQARVQVADASVIALEGDLTNQQVDAIVNAANEQLQHGGGVAAAIVKAGGEVIQEESDAYVAEHGALQPGEAAVTTAGDMPARWVVHVAGPVYDEDSADNERRLREAVTAALSAGAEAEARTIAFPAISAGVYGYPRDEATAIIASETVRWLGDNQGRLEEVRLVGIDQATASDFAAGLQEASG